MLYSQLGGTSKYIIRDISLASKIELRSIPNLVEVATSLLSSQIIILLGCRKSFHNIMYLFYAELHEYGCIFWIPLMVQGVQFGQSLNTGLCIQHTIQINWNTYLLWIKVNGSSSKCVNIDNVRKCGYNVAVVR